MKNRKKIIMISIIVIIILIGILVPITWYYQNVYNTTIKQDTKISIELGSGSNKIATILKENGVEQNYEFSSR